ncbi:hypothetical protein EPYR_02760 [Erwinia pyrifoliae DSM 12163]|nr:hypothetical protein EPYR_02760 [Erwinia pyrifoliae DSM 12163]
MRGGGRLNVQGFPPSVPPPEYEINANPVFSVFRLYSALCFCNLLKYNVNIFFRYIFI